MGETEAEATLVFLPGSLCDGRLFADQVQRLRPDLHRVVVDYAGCTSIGDMARRALDAVDGPLLPIGLSLGGIVAAEMIDQAPERVIGAVLLDTNLAPPDRMQLAARHRWASQARAGEFPSVIQELVPTMTVAPSINGPVIADMAMAVGPGTSWSRIRR